jgi:hypothetical protein
VSEREQKGDVTPGQADSYEGTGHEVGPIPHNPGSTPDNEAGRGKNTTGYDGLGNEVGQGENPKGVVDDPTKMLNEGKAKDSTGYIRNEGQQGSSKKMTGQGRPRQV